MNYAEYIIGLGLGILITLIARAVNDSRNEKQEALEEKERLHRLSHHEFDHHKHEIRDEFERVSKRFKVIVDRIDQHAGRIEKLESKKR